MGIMVIPEHRLKRNDINTLLATGPTNLVAELVLYRQKSERLGRIHHLHRQLCEKLDLASMIEAISIWLSNHSDHELLGYGHLGRQRFHAACSRHGLERRQYLEAASRLLLEPVNKETVGQLGTDIRYRVFPLTPGVDQLMVITRNEMVGSVGVDWYLAEVINELRGPIDRALAYEDLYNQARCDSLTGLSNRRVFEETAQREIAHAHRYHQPLAVAILDLDHFKAVNDTLGHGVGDQVLKQVARSLQGAVRDTDHLARVGGDEFVLLMPNTQQEDATRLCQRLCVVVADLRIQAPGAPVLGVSIGLTSWRHEEGLCQWLERADAALYRAKSQGRQQAVLHET